MVDDIEPVPTVAPHTLLPLNAIFCRNAFAPPRTLASRQVTRRRRVNTVSGRKVPAYFRIAHRRQEVAGGAEAEIAPTDRSKIDAAAAAFGRIAIR
jgi:hypothetical protein